MGDNEFPKFPQTVFLLPLLALPISAAIWYLAHDRSGAPQTAAMVAEREPSPYQVSIEVLFDGRPFTSQAPPSFWFRNEDSGKAVEANVELWNGKYLLRGLKPGKYGVQLTYNTNAANIVNSHGDYYSWTHFEVLEKNPSNVTVDLSRIIHLLKPEDNNSVLDGWAEEGCERTATVDPKVEFAWESLGNDVEYTYTIELITCPYKNLSSVVTATTKDTKFHIDLPSSEGNQFYLLRLHAQRSTKPVGILMTWGPNFLAWDYRFRVK